MKISGSLQYSKVAKKFLADVDENKFLASSSIVFKSAKGAYVKDADNNSYLDLSSSFALHGHAHPYIIKSARKQLKKGEFQHFVGKKEIELAHRLVKKTKGIEQIHFFSCYVDAVMTAIRLSRSFTQKEKIIIFSECHHSHYDACLASDPNDMLTFSDAQAEPISAGIPRDCTQNTIVLPINDIAELERAFEIYGDEIAAILVEPLIVSHGLIHLKDDFFMRLVQWTQEHDRILIRDEFFTAFRLSFSLEEFAASSQKDLVIMGNNLSMGMPFAVLGGQKKILKNLFKIHYDRSNRNSFHAQLAITHLDLFQETSFYRRMQKLTDFLKERFIQRIEKLESPHPFAIDLLHQGSICWLSIHPHNNNHKPVHSKDIWKSAEPIYNFLQQYLLKHGFLLPPHYLQTFYLNDAMGEEEIELFVHTLVKAIKKIPANLIN